MLLALTCKQPAEDFKLKGIHSLYSDGMPSLGNSPCWTRCMCAACVSMVIKGGVALILGGTTGLVLQ